MTNKGHRYELEICNDLNRELQNDGICYRSDFSGSSATGTTDIAVVSQHNHLHIEVKKRSAKVGTRSSGVFTGAQGETGLEALQRFVDGAPWFVGRYIVVKFPRREPVLMGADKLLQRLKDDGEAPADEYLDAKITPSNNISMRNVESLASAQAGDTAVEKILRKL